MSKNIKRVIYMIVGRVTIKIYAPWVHTLKEKRMVVKSIITKVRNKFNVSIAEVDENDIHQIVVLGFACVTVSVSHADSIIDNVLNFIEQITEGEITDVSREINWFYIYMQFYGTM